VHLRIPFDCARVSVNQDIRATMYENGFEKLIHMLTPSSRIGSKLCCLRSTPTETPSISENDFQRSVRTRLNTCNNVSGFQISYAPLSILG
jgi:hypothetical protein